MKRFLQRHPDFAEPETRIAIAEGVSSISQKNCTSYLKRCGYL